MQMGITDSHQSLRISSFAQIDPEGFVKSDLETSPPFCETTKRTSCAVALSFMKACLHGDFHFRSMARIFPYWCACNHMRNFIVKVGGRYKWCRWKSVSAIRSLDSFAHTVVEWLSNPIQSTEAANIASSRIFFYFPELFAIILKAPDQQISVEFVDPNLGKPTNHETGKLHAVLGWDIHSLQTAAMHTKQWLISAKNHGNSGCMSPVYN